MNTSLPFGSFIGELRREVEAHGFRFGEVLDITDGEVRKHTHEDAHFCFIVQGAYVSSVRDRESVHAASTMLFHPAGTTHRDRFHQRGGRFLTVSITLLLLTGMGNSAHIYDDLAPQFTDRFRVIALTRRGHGQSDKPRTGYDTETLVEDIARFLDALKIERAHLAGHSLAGDELTRFAGRYPERVAKLVYLDAANDRSTLTDQDIFNRIPEVFALLTPSLADAASYQTYRDWVRKKQYGFWSAAQEADFRETRFGADGELKPALPNYVVNALNQSTRLAHPDYGKIRAPALSFHALYSMATAFPWLAPDDDRETLRKAREFLHLTLIPHQRKQAERFGREVMGGRVIVWPATHHYLFITRRAEVRRAMWDFLRRK
jgi:pimeloyl-ACP methyl ester carboxylesterase